jgi:hypothetical protein
MAKRIWEIDLDRKKYKIELTHSYFTDKVDITASHDEFNRLRSIVMAPLLISLGIVAFWYNWYLAHNKGMFFESLAFTSPLPIVFAAYAVFFPSDLYKFSRNALIRFVIVSIIFLSLGFANLYALSNGVY